MKLSEELTWRGFKAETTFADISDLDKGPRKFYFGADPSSDSLTIGNLASLMMVYCFARHGYEPFLLVGGATGQIGDPKDTEERQLKALDEVAHNKACIAEQFKRILKLNDEFTLVDNYDWFKNIHYLDFLREVGKQFSMTQLLDREFVKARIGKDGVGISYAEFSYSLIQGYDFLHLYREYGVDMQLCGADQFGNCVSGIHLIKRLEGSEADVWSTPLVINKSTGRKFGKSEAGAVWLDEKKTSVYNFYQFWLNLDDEGVDYYMRIYTLLGKEELEHVLSRHRENPSERIAQRTLALEVTKIVHGESKARNAENLTAVLFGGKSIDSLSSDEIKLLSDEIPTVAIGKNIVDALVESGEASSKSEARRLVSSGAVSVNGEKMSDDAVLDGLSLVKKGKNKFILVE
jgi:tyrosyl-tRNA synthetase